jgi:ferrochelatase
VPAGVLLTNLGSPDGPDVRSVRRYLKEFLSDPMVVDVPRLIWWPLLRGVILPFRGPKSAELYRRVWTDEGSPLLAESRRQARGLTERLADQGITVELAMRYGSPSLEEGLARLAERGCDELVLLPAFPQDAGATVGTLVRRVKELLEIGSWKPRLTVVPPFPTDPGYIAAVASRVRETRVTNPTDHVVFSFHGLPLKQVLCGDPYRDHCEATAVALAAELGLEADGWTLVYQSRFGPAEWLQPYADQAVPELASRYPRILVACPGFAADCLETIDEIGEVLAEQFRAAGGTELTLVPSLNDHPRWLDALVELVGKARATS